MGEDRYNWNSFWDLASPEQAAQWLAEHHGPAAGTAAARCALAAHGDGRDQGYRFWQAVFAKLRAIEQAPAITDPAPAPD